MLTVSISQLDVIHFMLLATIILQLMQINRTVKNQKFEIRIEQEEELKLNKNYKQGTN